MKYILIIGDGMADNPVPELEDKTPLEAVHKPHMDALAQRGILGSVLTVPKNLVRAAIPLSCPFSAVIPTSIIRAAVPWKQPEAAWNCTPEMSAIAVI